MLKLSAPPDVSDTRVSFDNPFLQSRRFGEHATTRKNIFDNTLEAAKALGGTENARYALTFNNLTYGKPLEVTPVDIKRARLQGKTLAQRLQGDVTLTDKASGKVLDTRRMTIAHVPYLTDTGEFVQQGVTQILSHQLRLDPGVYVRQKSNGHVEAHINVLPGNGVSHRIRLEPATGVFKVDIGQSEIPALPLLRAIGVNDQELKSAVGEKLYAVNDKAAKPHHLKLLFDQLGPRGLQPDDADYAKLLGQALRQMNFDPWVMQRTLGIPTTAYTPAVALQTVKKILAVSQKQQAPDDRDSLVYQKVHGPEHLIAERITRAAPVLQKAMWRITNKGTLDALLPGFLTPAIRSVFLASGLAQSPEGVHGIELVDHGSRITKVGQGGMGRTADAVPESARNLSPSHYLFIDPIKSSESESIGLDLRTAFGTRLDRRGNIYAPVRDVRTGKIVYKTPRQLADSILAFPGQYERGEEDVPAIVRGVLEYAKRDHVQYVAPSNEQAFSPTTGLVDLKAASKAHRTSMGARYTTQALALVNPEAPLVRNSVPGQPKTSFEELFGKHVGTVSADNTEGVVTAVSPDEIKVKYADGEVKKHPLYNHSPFGRMTMIHNTPKVKVGDTVAPGQLLATSNFTDANGHLAYGANARVGLVPYLKGATATYEDAILASESFAKRLTSEHLLPHHFVPDENTTASKAAFAAAFPGEHPKALYENYDDSGVVKPGTIVQPDQPLVMAIRRDPGGYHMLHGRRAGLKDASMKWEHSTPGRVVDVVPRSDGYMITVHTAKQLQNGDKLSGRHGNKGVVTLLPDDQMPHTADGKPLDVVFSTLGNITRVNPSVIVEMALGKVAEKTGKPYVMSEQQNITHLAKYAKQQLAEHNIPDKEPVIDPATGVTTPPVMVGNLYIMKLQHLAEKKVKGHGLGGYDESGTPTRGSEGASRMSMGDTNALVAHNAPEVLRDLKLYRGQDNAEFWAAYMAGMPPPRPTESKQYGRFLNKLRGAGIDVVQQGPITRLSALTSAKVQQLAGTRELQNAETVQLKDGRPVKGGLFDPDIFGAQDSASAWGKITLHEPYLNPVFEEPARRLLNLTGVQLREMIAGRHKLPTGETGPLGLYNALSKVNVKEELAKTRDALQSARKTVRDDAARKLRYLKGLETNNQTPKDWFLSAVPVLPPALRPARTLMGGGAGGAMVSDVNLLYKELMLARDGLRSLRGKVQDTGNEQLAVYDTIKAVFGLGDPTDPRNQTAQVKGVLRDLFPGSSKHSYVQQRLLGTPANLSGRGQVVPNADLDMDQVGLPEHLAWNVFAPSVVRRMVRNGMSRMEAVEEVEKRTDRARRSLLEEMNVRPVTMTRYPVLHKFNVMGFWPKLVAGDAIHTNPAVNKSYTMDHDGDTVTVHAPVDDSAIERIKKNMMPSRNVRSPANFHAGVYMPNMEFLLGVYHASTAKKDQAPRTFRSRQDVMNAYAKGEITVDTPVTILG